jgi:hypothetical protein
MESVSSVFKQCSVTYTCTESSCTIYTMNDLQSHESLLALDEKLQNT